MQIRRLFSTDGIKGEKNYLNSQKKYEVVRTVLYFGISLSLFVAGYVTTESKLNLLTIVAVLGCLPASKSLVSAVMYLRCHSLDAGAADRIEEHCGGLSALYDMMFTSYEKNYLVGHLVVKGNTICGYSDDPAFPEQDFYRHIDGILKTDRYMDVHVKIFTDLKKYTERLEQLQSLETDTANTQGILNTLKSVAL